MPRQLLENALSALYRTSTICLSLLVIGFLIILGLPLISQPHAKRSIKDTQTKPPFFKFLIFAEKNQVKLGEDIIIDALLKNEGDGYGFVFTLFFNEYSTVRVPKNSIVFDIRDVNGNQVLQDKTNLYYPQYAQATLQSFRALLPDNIVGLQINLTKDQNFLYPISKPGVYTIQATLETECRKYIEERIKTGAIKESDLGSNPKETLEKYINGTFKSNTIQIEVQK